MAKTLGLIFLAIIPVILICTYIYRKDKNKEPGKLLVMLFGLGLLSCAVTLTLFKGICFIFPFMAQDTSAMNFFEIMTYSFIGVALIEEFSKWIMVYFAGYSHRAYDEIYDGIVYSVYVSLGFAGLENLMYVLNYQSLTVGIQRGILSVPGHACDAVFMGYYLSLAKTYAYRGRKDLERKNLLLSVVVPTILHGFYDFCLFSGNNILMSLFLAFVVALYWISIKKIKQLANPALDKKIKEMNYNQNLVNNNQINTSQTKKDSNNNLQVVNNKQLIKCKSCGIQYTGDYCPKCGTRRS